MLGRILHLSTIWTMDYQIVPKTENQPILFVISVLIFSLLPFSSCIVNRDLVLTPKHGLQLSGKRIFYEELHSNQKSNLNHNDTECETIARPWERTLKHVTYLTLFTNIPNGIITGNFSKVKEYNEFLNSTYERSAKQIDTRFGDIVTLAEGRLVKMLNGSFQFIEGMCNYECARESNIIAIWHVQKIRHRDPTDRKYHYEMKFSVSPINSKTQMEIVVRGGPNKRTLMEERQNNVQTFIQKEDDYPHTFRKIVLEKDENFLEKNYETARNFRQVSTHYQTQQVTPIPQSTFLRGVYHHPPAPMQIQRPNLHPPAHLQSNHHHHHHQQLLLPEHLNIGEFYKGNFIPKTTSKIELFPNLLNMFMSKPHSLPPPTKFRPPTYQMKFPRPEMYALQQHQTQEYQESPFFQSQEQFNQRTPAPVPIVTHHYHHHFFMPNNSAITIEQAIEQSDELTHNSPGVELYHNEVTEPPATQVFIANFNEAQHPTTTMRHHHFPQIQGQVHTEHHSNIPEKNFNRNYHSSYHHIQQLTPPAPQKFTFANTQIEQQHMVHVTPASPLKKPQYMQRTHQQTHYGNQPFTSSLEYTTVHVPLLISYPAPINEEKSVDVSTPHKEPFVQSDPIEEPIRYSEPDPLYANINQGNNEYQNKFLSNAEHEQNDQQLQPQLQSPSHFHTPQTKQPQNIQEADNNKEHSESVEAQLPAPNYSTMRPEEVKTTEVTKRKTPLETATQASKTSTELSIDKITTEPMQTEASNSMAAATKSPPVLTLRNKRISLKSETTTTTSTTSKPPSTPNPQTVEAIKLKTVAKPRKTFLSTSTTESTLRSISRYRNGYSRNSSSSTTTTEKPVLKWAPKRKNVNTKLRPVTSTTPANENKIEEIDENDYTDNDSDENDDFKVNESNNRRKITSSLLTTVRSNFNSEISTEISNANSTSASSTISPTLSSPQTPSPLLSQNSQSEAEIYEILTQKSVSKSISLKVGNNGEEIPVIVDDKENEVKTV